MDKLNPDDKSVLLMVDSNLPSQILHCPCYKEIRVYLKSINFPSEKYQSYDKLWKLLLELVCIVSDTSTTIFWVIF